MSAATPTSQTMRELLEVAADAMVVVDQDGTILVVNAKLTALFGYEPHELVGHPVELLIPERSRAVHRHHRQGFVHAPGTSPMRDARELRARRRDGSEFPIEISLSSLRTPEGATVLATIRDISSRKRAEERMRRTVSATYKDLREDARVDALTGVANRRRLAEDLATMHARAVRHGHSYCIAIADIDRFKEFNDGAGHVAGDEVLRRVACALARSLRSTDGLYRYGGEEFVALLPEQRADAAVLAARRLCEAVEALAIVHPGGGLLTVSVGVAILSSDVSSASLVEAADAALYRSKGAGGNRVELAPTTPAAGGAASAEEPAFSANGRQRRSAARSSTLLRWHARDRAHEAAGVAIENGRVAAIENGRVREPTPPPSQ